VKPPVRSNAFSDGVRRLSAVAARPSERAAVGLSQLVRTVLLVLLLAGALTAWASPAAAAWPVDFANTTLIDVNVAPNGHIGLREGGCNSVVGQAFAALAADGTPLWSVQPTGDLAYIDGCIGPFYDHNSNAYFSGDSDANSRFGTPRHLVSYDASGHLRWSQPLHYGFNTRAQQSVGEPFGNPGNIAEGADGSIYLIDGEDTGSGGGIQTHLRGFNEQTGAPGMDIDLTAVGGYPFGTLVQTTATGVLVGTVNGARFYSYSGQLEWAHDFWSLPGGQTGSVGVRERTPDGGLLVGASYDTSSPEGNCMNGVSLSNPTQPVIELHKVTASGLAWTLTTPPGATGTCADLLGSLIIRGTPDGGAVVSSDFAHPQVGRALSGVAPDGTVRWTMPLDSAAVLADIRVGADGTVVLIEHTTRPCAATTCGRLLLRFLSATTGTPNHADLTVDVPDPPSQASTADPSLPALLDAHTAPGRLVLGYQTSDDPTFGAFPGPFESVNVLPVDGLGADVSFNAGAAPDSYGAAEESQRGIGAGGNSGATATHAPSSVSTPPPALSYPCAPVHGSIGKRLLASLRCTAIQTKLEFECGFGVAKLVVGPLKILEAAKTADGLYNLSKVKKQFQPLARFFNDIKKAKFGKHAPRGFRTGAEVIDKLKKAKTAYKVIMLLPDIAKAVSKADFSEIALDMDDILGLRPCVEGIVNALE